MAQHADKVEQRRQQMKIEEWASKVKMIHAYPKDDDKIFDVIYNDGKIIRENLTTKKVETILPEGSKESKKSYLARVEQKMNQVIADIKAGFDVS